ncbi:MAG: T9SS type A sorting domain-containing protein [Crocinitomicaceae bacterium]|nr:T9SS type A sorting domain-containing protein [Crocinitomicaceae bacterium]
MKYLILCISSLILINGLSQQELEMAVYADSGIMGTLGDVKRTADNEFLALHHFHTDSNQYISLLKYNENFDLQWSRAFYDSSQFYHSPRVLHITADNSIIMTASIIRPVIMKLDMNGNMLWSKEMPPSSNFDLHAVTSDSNGDIYISGGGCSVGAIGVIKISSNGNFLWIKSYYATGGGGANALTSCDDGNIFIGGLTNTASDMTFIKIDTSGNVIYSKTHQYNDFLRIVPIDVEELDNGEFMLLCNAYGPQDDYSMPCIIKCDANGNIITNKIVTFMDYIQTWNFGSNIEQFDNGNLLFSFNATKIDDQRTIYLETDVNLNPLREFGHHSTSMMDPISVILDNQTVVTMEKSFQSYLLTKIDTSYCNNDVTPYQFDDFVYTVDSTIAPTFTPNINYYDFDFLSADLGVLDSIVCTGFLSVTDQQPVEVEVYPNPTDGIFTISSNHPFNIKLYTLAGKLLVTKSCSGKSIQMDISDYQSGHYVLVIESDAYVITRKLVKI